MKIKNDATTNRAFAFSCLLTAIFAALTTIKLLFNGAGWGDEFCFADKAINIAIYGESISHHWTETQVGLFYRLLSVWLRVFGVSHLSVCSIEVFFVAISALLISLICLKRNIFDGCFAICLFNVLYWSGVNFLWSTLSGRLDGITLFVSILLVEALSRDCKNSSKFLTYLATVCAVITMTSIYTIPLIGLFGVMLLAIPQNSVTRKEMFIRGLVCALAFIASEMVVLVLQFYHHTLLRYGYMLFHHCTTLSGDSNGSTVGFPECYQSDMLTVLMVCAVLVLSVFLRKIRTVRYGYLVFTALIPLLMVCIGRYAFYYHWLFYVPTTIAVAWSLQFFKHKTVRYILFCAFMIFAAYSQVDWFVKTGDRSCREERTRMAEILKRHIEESDARHNIIVTADWCYYAAIEAGYRPWVKLPHEVEFFSYDTDSRMNEMLEKKIKNPSVRNKVKLWMDKYEKPTTKKLPDEGFLFAHCDDANTVLVNALQKVGYQVRLLEKDGSFSISDVRRVE